MRGLVSGVVIVSVVLLASPATAEVRLTVNNGRVSISAKNATVSQILAEWARVGQTRIVNGERVAGAPLTIELADVPEVEAIEILLRSAGGYLLAQRPTNVVNLSRYDRILILPTTSGAPRPAGSPASVPPAFPQPQFNPPGQPPSDDNDAPERPAAQNPGDPLRPPVFNRFPTPQPDDTPAPAAPPPARSPQVPLGVAVPGMPTPTPQPAQRPGASTPR